MDRISICKTLQRSAFRHLSSGANSSRERKRGKHAWSLVATNSPLIRAWLSRYRLPETDVEDISETVLSAAVANLNRFEHSGRVGAFRSWLRTITVNSLRDKFRSDVRRPDSPGGSAFLDSLRELEDPESGLSQIWDRLHDKYLARTLLAWAEPE